MPAPTPTMLGTSSGSSFFDADRWADQPDEPADRVGIRGRRRPRRAVAADADSGRDRSGAVAAAHGGVRGPVVDRLVPAPDMRVEQQLLDQHRQRVLRRLPVRPVDLAQRGWQRVPQPGLAHRAGLPRAVPVPHAGLATLDVRGHPRPARGRRCRLRPSTAAAGHSADRRRAGLAGHVLRAGHVELGNRRVAEADARARCQRAARHRAVRAAHRGGRQAGAGAERHPAERAHRSVDMGRRLDRPLQRRLPPGTNAPAWPGTTTCRA